MEDLEARIVGQAGAARAINGEWWQIVFAPDQHPGLSYVRISLSAAAGEHAMYGTAFHADGREWAKWSSDAVAIRATMPVELFYVWRGTKFTGENQGTVSGLGRFRFDSVGLDACPMGGEGSFTAATTDEMKFGDPLAVKLERLTEAESAELALNPAALSALAITAYKRLQIGRAKPS